MSLYDWPPARPGDGESDDDPGGRGAFFRRLRPALKPAGVPPAAGGAPQPAPATPAAPMVRRAPGTDREHLWQSLGPDTVIDGQVIGRGRVTGRVNMLAVHPDGERLYAASANGGVWHSGDGGKHWKSLGGLAPTPSRGTVNRPAHRNACGAIAVDWDAAGGEVVYVGTGEPSGSPNAQPGQSLGGLGILRAVNPAASTSDNPWVREADNLLGAGVYRIALQPGGTGVVAATTIGLFERPAAATADTDWVKVNVEPFDAIDVRCTDVLWTRGDGTRPERLWVWVQHGRKAGLWVRAAGATKFEPLIEAKPTASASIADAPRERAVLAVSNPAASPDQVYLFINHGKDDGSGLPRLFRIACATSAKPTVERVIGVPDVLGKQGWYDIALAVHPAQKDRVVIGGSTFAAVAPDGRAQVNTGNANDAGIVYADVGTGLDGVLRFGRRLPFKMIGAGVHADVHDLAYSNTGARLWAACDGGVYRSDRPTDLVGFAAMNDGISVVESNYLANHPACDGLVVSGLQDNGVIRRLSSAVWLGERDGDGGGVAFDPTRPTRYLHQAFHGRWRSSDSAFVLRAPEAADDISKDHCAFYSTPAAIAKSRPGAPAGRQTLTQVIVGTSRLWYTEDFGATWVTLKSATPPPAGDLKQDAFGEKITVCRWQSSEVAWVLGEGRVRRYARTAGTDVAAGPGTWTDETVIKKGEKNKKDTTSADGPVRDATVWTDIAVNLEPPGSAPGSAPGTVRGTRGALYLGTTGNPDDDDVDTLYWFNGTDKWFATHLRRDGVPAPVTAIACDPAFPNEVYVGTTVGVWKGVRNLTDPNAPTWGWSDRLNGLPEAAVEDLAIHTRGPLRLLRAAIAARGVWELRLDAARVDDLAYLRAHEHDLRHTLPTSPLADDGVTARSWHASPDVHVRRAPLSCPAPPTLPWIPSSAGIEHEKLRRYQSALRARLGDLRIRPTGEFDEHFNEVLRSLGAPRVGPTVRLDRAFWEASMQMPWAVAEPWGSTARPTHADLIEFSAALPEPPTRRQASCELPRDASKVDVLVQARCLGAIDGATVRVVLLQWTDPAARPTSRWDDITTWPGGNVPWTVAVNQMLNNGTTAQALGSGWRFVGTRQTLAGQSLDATHPGVATFDLDLSLVRDDRLVLLVAVMRFGANAAAVPVDTLENLVLGQSNIAVRSLRIRGQSVQAPAARSPFATVPYALELQPSATQNTRLAAALTAVRGTLDEARADMLDKAAILVAKLTPAGPMDYAGVNEEAMYFSASLLKSVLLYASFELVAQVNALAPTITAPTAKKFFDAVEREFMATIVSSVRRINKAGPWRRTSFRQALTAEPAGANQWRVRLSDAHAEQLRRIFADQGQNITPRNTMQRLGYCFVNRALECAGFLDTGTDTGLWMATDYGSYKDFNVPVVTMSAGRVPKRGTSSAAMTALAMASLWTHIHRSQLIDAAASAAMRGIIARGGAWFSTLDAAVRATFSFADIGAKVGHSGSRSAFVGSVQSEAAFLRRTDGAQFIAVWQNVPDELDSEPIYRVLDTMIRQWP